jgi:hypothetical protein
MSLKTLYLLAEKAGVGGSIPSLATIFSITYELNSDLKPHRR